MIRTYDRNRLVKRRRSRKMSHFLDMFDFEHEDEEEDDEEEDIDDLERFSQDLAAEEKRIREKEMQSRKEGAAPSSLSAASPATPASKSKSNIRGGSIQITKVT